MICTVGFALIFWEQMIIFRVEIVILQTKGQNKSTWKNYS